MQPRCWIEPRALADLWSEARSFRFRETGGALLGWRSDNDAVIAQILGPGPKAQHGLRHFEPDGAWQVRMGQRIYEESGRTVAYLGDWHTHPLSPPAPSNTDELAAQLISEDPGFRAPSPLYAVIGYSAWPEVCKRAYLALFMWDPSLEQFSDVDIARIRR